MPLQTTKTQRCSIPMAYVGTMGTVRGAGTLWRALPFPMVQNSSELKALYRNFIVTMREAQEHLAPPQDLGGLRPCS